MKIQKNKSFRANLLTVILVASVLLVSAATYADWMKMDPPPDVDKSAHGHTGTSTCWLATAANMLAGAGYGDGTNVQDRADDIYTELVANYGTGGGWTDTAISWWLGSANNTWAATNPYSVVTVYGNKSPKNPWANSNGAKFIGNELRRCQFLGLSISWPTAGSSVGSGGHAIACFGDSGSKNELTSNPSQVIVVDSDTDNGGDVQTYTYDNYTNPNPGGANEGNGWYFNYSNNHPYIKHIVTLCPTDDPGDNVATQKVVGSYKIHQDQRFFKATDLHYTVETDVEVLSYKTEISWSTDNKPSITEIGDPRNGLIVDWDLSDNPVPYCNWVTITTEFVEPSWNSISYKDVHFTYPDILRKPLPWFRWELKTAPVRETNIPNISGGYVVGAFDLIDPNPDDPGTGEPPMPTVVGQYRLLHEYDFDQNPEDHFFLLHSLEPMGYLVSNLRFGHSYGMLTTEELWHFDDWMTFNNEQMPLAGEIAMPLQWQGLLPYPEGEDYTGGEKPPLCTEYLPQDLNKDCCVDIGDLAIFAEAYLRCTIPKPIISGD